mmetsp:Transcript_68283/g.142276  ORF Transcript_68283/g.142276 Transcript_68283/m.142276 type:complete len:220 (+) Transcript_68283:237-896(+)
MARGFKTHTLGCVPSHERALALGSQSWKPLAAQFVTISGSASGSASGFGRETLRTSVCKPSAVLLNAATPTCSKNGVSPSLSDALASGSGCFILNELEKNSPTLLTTFSPSPSGALASASGLFNLNDSEKNTPTLSAMTPMSSTIGMRFASDFSDTASSDVTDSSEGNWAGEEVSSVWEARGVASLPLEEEEENMKSTGQTTRSTQREYHSLSVTSGLV